MIDRLLFDRTMIRAAWAAVAVSVIFVLLGWLASFRPAIECPPARPYWSSERHQCEQIKQPLAPSDIVR